MATRQRDFDFSLEGRKDYAMFAMGILAGVLGVFTLLLAPIYVFASFGSMLNVGSSVLFGVGCYAMIIVFLYGWVN